MFRSSSALFAVAFSLSTAQLVCGMYDPQLGRFLTIDPIGYADGVNAYRAYFAPKGIDASGQCDCCCCPERLDLSDITPRYIDIKGSGVFGFVFEFKVLATLRMTDERVALGGRGCEIEWWECAATGGDIGQQPGQWFRPPSPSDEPPGPVHSDWNDPMPGDCESSFQRHWADAPSLLPSGVVLGPPPRIDIKFAIRISGGRDCIKCGPPVEKYFTLHVEQKSFDPSFPDKTTFVPDPLKFDVGLTGEPSGCTKASIPW